MKKFVKIVIGIVAVLFAALLIVGALSRDKIEIPAGFAGQYVDVNGAKIRYVQKGNGKDILLIHGTPGSIEDWNPVIDTLAQKFRVTAYDRPANGFSSAEGCDFSVAYNAKTAFSLIDALKLNKPLVVGHSYGAAVALNMATENDPRVKGFVVESSSAYSYNARKTMLGRLIRLPLVGRGFSAIISSVAGGMIEKGMKMAFHPNEDAIPAGFIDMKKVMISQTKVINAQAREIGRYRKDILEMRVRYAQIRQPVTLVCGRADNPYTVVSTETIATVVPGAKIFWFDNVGHMVQFARPDQFVKIVEDAAK